jgi:hypothetical protein
MIGRLVWRRVALVTKPGIRQIEELIVDAIDDGRATGR